MSRGVIMIAGAVSMSVVAVLLGGCTADGPPTLRPSSSSGPSAGPSATAALPDHLTPPGRAVPVEAIKGNGAKALAPFAGGGEAAVTIVCFGGDVQITRDPDVGGIISCSGQQTTVTFHDVAHNQEPVKVIADPATRWAIAVTCCTAR